MAEFSVKTKGGASPKGKPRVYFTSHAEDFSRYFDKICADLFKTHDPAIYYTEDMTAPLDSENIEVDLGRMNLFVVPVTFRLMNENNRAMRVDIAYAKEHNIPILPFMMESEIDEIYSREENFGKRQYLSPFGGDATAISYEEKLRKSLDSLLISDEMAKRIRAAFDAYVFLSYRKKDRKYATELMRIIHRIPGCRDIAVWYDEFLAPGESFIANIERAMEQSKLFTLLVTPSLLEEGNFVMTEEYPAALRMGKEVLPTEMVATNHARLKEKFNGIPEPVSTGDRLFSDTLLKTVEGIAKRENDEEPEHNLLIGLAYLEGIDVEVDTARGVELITKAAEAGLPEAMIKLYNMYDNDITACFDFAKAVKWAERLVDYSRERYGELHSETLRYLNNLAVAYGKNGNYKKAFEINQNVYRIRCLVYGEEHPITLISLNNLAMDHAHIGNYERAVELYEQAYALQSKILGNSHGDTLMTLSNLAVCCNDSGNYARALELNKQIYEVRSRTLGREHRDTMNSLNNLAYTYDWLKQSDKACECFEELYSIQLKAIGEEHPYTLRTINNLSCMYSKLGDHERSLELCERLVELCYKVFGEKHPYTLLAVCGLADECGYTGRYKRSLELYKGAYDISTVINGENHEKNVEILNGMAGASLRLDDYDNAAVFYSRSFDLCCKLYGNGHKKTVFVLNQIAYISAAIGDYERAVAFYKYIYEAKCESEASPEELLGTVRGIMNCYGKLKQYGEAIKYNHMAYEMSCRIYGKEHNDSLILLNNLGVNYFYFGERDKAVSLLEELYEVQKRIYGESHSYTVGTRRNIDFIKSC